MTGVRLHFAALLLLTLQGSLAGWGAEPEESTARFRFGFSSQIFQGLNETDARAALKVWARTLAVERGIAVDPSFAILNGTAALKQALLNHTIDAASMTTTEYWELSHSVRFGPTVLLPFSRGKSTEEYLLLVRRDNPATCLADLRSHSIELAKGAQVSLASAWLETLLLETNLGPADRFWGRSTESINPSQTVLHVFFRQVDACVTTRDSFRVSAELNPQLGQQLKILAESPPLSAAPVCFREDFTPQHRGRFFDEVGQVVETLAGRQTLALFHSEQVVVRPRSELDDECALLDRHQRLLDAALRQRAPAPPANDSGKVRP